MNLYEYVRSRPTVAADSAGLRWEPLPPSQYIPAPPLDYKDPVFWRINRWVTDGPVVGWNTRFRALYTPDDCAIVFKVKIQLNAQDSAAENTVALNSLAWRSSFEGRMSNRWELVPADTTNCCECKDGISIRFGVEWGWWGDEGEADVFSTAGRSNRTEWYTGSPGFTNYPFATLNHELMHWFGVKDEYLDPQFYPNKTAATLPANHATSIMGVGLGSVYRRHIEQIALDMADVDDKLPCPDYEVHRQ